MRANFASRTLTTRPQRDLLNAGAQRADDGDKVTVAFSNPILTLQNATHVLITTAARSVPEQLQQIDLKGPTLAVSPLGTSITLTVVRAAHGDGLANVGYIDATEYDLGDVTVPGDFDGIRVGEIALTPLGIASLTVRSLAVSGLLRSRHYLAPSRRAPRATSPAVSFLYGRGRYRRAILPLEAALRARLAASRSAARWSAV